MKEKYFSPTFREGCFLATSYNQNQSLAELWLKVLLEVIICMRKKPMSVLIRNNSSFLILVSHIPKSSSCLEMSLFSWNVAWERQASHPIDRAARPLKLQILVQRMQSHLPNASKCVSLFISLHFLTYFYFLSPCKYSLLFIIRIKH